MNCEAGGGRRERLRVSSVRASSRRSRLWRTCWTRAVHSASIRQLAIQPGYRRVVRESDKRPRDSRFDLSRANAFHSSRRDCYRTGPCKRDEEMAARSTEQLLNGQLAALSAPLSDDSLRALALIVGPAMLLEALDLIDKDSGAKSVTLGIPSDALSWRTCATETASSRFGLALAFPQSLASSLLTADPSTKSRAHLVVSLTPSTRTCQRAAGSVRAQRSRTASWLRATRSP